jgi:hypothetical protein
MRYVYETCCVDCDGPSIIAMLEAAREVSLKTFRRRCDTREWEAKMGYERHGGLPLSRDWHVSYHKSVFRGRPCYYAVHSAIEYIFTAGERA